MRRGSCGSRGRSSRGICSGIRGRISGRIPSGRVARLSGGVFGWGSGSSSSSVGSIGSVGVGSPRRRRRWRDGNKPGGRHEIAKLLVVKVVTETLGSPHQIPVGEVVLAVPVRQLGAKVRRLVGDRVFLVCFGVRGAQAGVVGGGVVAARFSVVVIRLAVVDVDVVAVVDVGVDGGLGGQVVAVSLAGTPVPGGGLPDGGIIVVFQLFVVGAAVVYRTGRWKLVGGIEQESSFGLCLLL